MKKIIIVLISAVAVFFATLLFTNHYISRKARENADTLNSRVINDFCSDLDNDLQQVTVAVNGFLYGNFYMRNDSVAPDGTPKLYIRDSELHDFSTWIERDMRDLLRVNPGIMAAVFFIDDSFSIMHPEYGFHENYAIRINQDKKIPRELINYNFMASKTYQKVRSTQQHLWAHPSPTSPLRRKVIIYHVPVFLEDGSFFGIFAVNVDTRSLSQNIAYHQPYGKDNSETIIYDGDGRIVVAYPEPYEKYDSIQQLTQTISPGTKYKYYERHITQAGWNVITVCREEVIYRNAAHIRWIVFLTSAVGMLLMLLCFIVISQQVRKNLHEKAVAENEIQMAANVQMSILKEPHFTYKNAELNAFLHPAREAGGDLYGYAQREDKLIFCIGDVSGKGMSAALFMTQVISLFRNAVRYTCNPDEIVSQINNVLSENNPDLTFCTYFVGVLEGNQLTFCNAGHNYPVLIRKGKKAEYVEIQSNIALGIMEDFPFMVESLTLEPGDTLLLYTDGVTEASNKQEVNFGEERLLTTLSASDKDYIHATLHAIQDFVGDYEQSDDITLMEVSVS